MGREYGGLEFGSPHPPEINGGLGALLQCSVILQFFNKLAHVLGFFGINSCFKL